MPALLFPLCPWSALDSPLPLAILGGDSSELHGGAIAALFLLMLLLTTTNVLRRTTHQGIPLLLFLSGIVIALATATP